MTFYNTTTPYSTSNMAGPSSGPFQTQPFLQGSAPFGTRSVLDQPPKRMGYDSSSSYGHTYSHGPHPQGHSASQYSQRSPEKAPPHMRPTASNYKQFVGPPQHPAQRERSRSRSPVRAQANHPTSYAHTQPQSGSRYPYSSTTKPRLPF